MLMADEIERAEIISEGVIFHTKDGHMIILINPKSDSPLAGYRYIRNKAGKRDDYKGMPAVLRPDGTCEHFKDGMDLDK